MTYRLIKCIIRACSIETRKVSKMQVLLIILALIIGINQSRQRRIKSWERRLYDGSNRPKF
jgi:hypothetical protein